MDFTYLIKGVEHNSSDEKFVLSNKELRDLIWQHLEQRPLIDSKQSIEEDKRLGNSIIEKLIEQKKIEVEMLKENVNNTIQKEKEKLDDSERDLLELENLKEF